MRNTDTETFAAMLVATLTGVYRQPEPRADVIAIWFGALAGFALDDIRRALSLHVRDPDRGQYPPRPADVVRLIEGSTQTQGAIAWAKVERALRSVGSYASVAFDDPLIHVVLSEMGDWPSLCQTTVEDLPFRRRDFERRYASYRAQRVTPPYPSHLVGLTEGECRIGGYPVHPPTLIGDPDTATAVMASGGSCTGPRITGPSDIARLLRLSAPEVEAMGEAGLLAAGSGGRP